MSDPLNGMEQRLADALARGADAAPSAIGLAEAARTRARQRRRTRLAAGAFLSAVAVGVPTAVLATGGSDGAGDGTGPANDHSVATDPQPPGEVDVGGYRWESWHGVTVQVPDTWSYGNPSTWCADGGDAETPLVGRPGPMVSILCTPVSGYGLTFDDARGNDVDWPVAAQHSDSWPDGAYVGATTVGGVVVTVAAPEAATVVTVLDSARAIAGIDANGCGAKVWVEPVLGVDTMSVCRYDRNGDLEQSELLTGDDATAAATAIAKAPTTAYAPPCPGEPDAGELEEYVVMHTTTHAYRVVWQGAKCPDRGVFIDDRHRRELTSDVLYWALSPGWTGAVDGDVPLPPELRQR